MHTELVLPLCNPFFDFLHKHCIYLFDIIFDRQGLVLLVWSAFVVTQMNLDQVQFVLVLLYHIYKVLVKRQFLLV